MCNAIMRNLVSNLLVFRNEQAIDPMSTVASIMPAIITSRDPNCWRCNARIYTVMSNPRCITFETRVDKPALKHVCLSMNATYD